ncbi:MAG: leucine-rich repeat protein [Oscillospiraceae bacterium]
MPETVTEIGKGAFRDCSRLKSIEIPESVTEIGSHTFSNTKLGSIRVPDTVTDMGDHVFSGCTELKEVTLPNIRQNIMAGMFEGCTSLEKIVLPETVTAIRSDAFEGCTALKDITWSKAPEIIESNAFRNCSALKEVTIPGTVKSIGDCAFLNCDALTTVTIPDSVTSIGEQVFYDCDALTTVKLGSGLKSIPASTFEHCDVLESLRIPRRVTTIGDNAFKDCVKLTSITIPRSVTKISSNAFSYPKILTIYGVSGTYAETFAKENSIKFVDQQIKATTASLDKTELTINKGAAAQLNLSVTPENFTDIVDWKSTDTNIVTVSDNGVVKAVGVGTATVKVTVGDVSASCKVTVLQPVTGINLNKSSLTMDALGTFQMTASVYPDGANDKRITWSSSDPAIASVDENGLVTALKKGTATITAAAMDGSGVKSTCKVTVSNTAYVCTDPAQLESPHNYDNSCTDVWSYRLDGASSLNVTFDARTEMEDGFDYLYILDGSGKEVGKYTGKELAGKTVSVPGDTVQIRMASDKGNNAWGFKVTSVKAGSETCQHVWDNGKVTKEPTETETGIKTFTCTRCGETKTEVIPALSHEHSYKAVVTAPTCTEKGYTTHTCSCGDSYVDTYTNALGHAWDGGTVTKQPTVTETGIRTYTCTRCGETKTETIPKLTHEHSYKAVVTAPTCTEKGYTTHTCACGDSYVDTYTDALGHAWDEGKVTKEPTETETGVKTFTCTRCGETKTETIPATGVVDVTQMFTDVTKNWAYPGIQYCVTHQLMSGIGNNLFGPKLTTTRAQIVQILYNLEGEPKVSGTTPFTDLTQDWYQDAILWAYQTGVVAGTSSTTFAPDQPVTREQIAVILMEYVTRVLKLERTWTPADLSAFPDAGSVSDWAKDAMADAVALGLISGASNGGQTYLEPQGSATREQVATILMEFCKNVKK